MARLLYTCVRCERISIDRLCREPECVRIRAKLLEESIPSDRSIKQPMSRLHVKGKRVIKDNRGLT